MGFVNDKALTASNTAAYQRAWKLTSNVSRQ